MMSSNHTTRRSFLALTAAAPFALAKPKHIPVGLELYSVRNELKQDLPGTVRAVAKMGYEGVEFYSPYFDWTPDYAKEVRKLLDDLGIRCFSTHNGAKSFTPENIPHAIEINQIIGSKFIIMASAGKNETLDDWKKVAATLTTASEKLKPAGMRTGFHNHKAEFVPIDGKRPMDILAANTPKSVTLQLDIGTCIEAGSDPIAWINSNPGRITSMHCKDWAPEPGKGYDVLVGEGVVPWKKALQAAEKTGGIEYYLIEQEGSRFPAMETAERCLASFKKLQTT
jgi:sugar phosphate isomerase/epimerase